MSNRVAVPDGQKDVVWMRDVEDRLKALETRKVQGDLALDSATVGDLTTTASATTPVKLAGSATWTQDVEYLGKTPPSADNGNHALVTRDELGRIQDIQPRPIILVTSGPGGGLSVPTATVTNITAVGSAVIGGPFAESDMYLGAGIFRVPATGYWTFQHVGIWPGINDTTLRQLALDLSFNGGVSFGTVATDYRVQAPPGDNVYHDFSETIGLVAGTLARFWVRQRSAANPWPYFNDNMTMKWERGPL